MAFIICKKEIGSKQNLCYVALTLTQEYSMLHRFGNFLFATCCIIALLWTIVPLAAILQPSRYAACEDIIMLLPTFFFLLLGAGLRYIFAGNN